ncbi:hypothetical protein, partial [Acetobacter oeni]
GGRSAYASSRTNKQDPPVLESGRGRLLYKNSFCEITMDAGEAMVRRAQLYLWSEARTHHIALHEFYVEQMRSRILSQFDDLEGQADRHTEEAYQRMSQAPGYSEIDMAAIAEAAYDKGSAHYQTLTGLRKQMLLGGLAGMFHQWDKTVREHLERELRHDFDGDKIEKAIWKAPLADVMDVFEQFGWPVKALPCYAKIDALQLVVNIYKHGKGRSLNQLAKAYGEYVRDPIRQWTPEGMAFGLDHEWLTVTDEHFGQFANAIRDFWQEMPERLYFDLSTASS